MQDLLEAYKLKGMPDDVIKSPMHNRILFYDIEGKEALEVRLEQLDWFEKNKEMAYILPVNCDAFKVDYEFYKILEEICKKRNYNLN